MSRFAFMNNPYRVIKRLAFVTGFCIVSCTAALAQQSLYIFIQSDNQQPFYVQMGEKVYSSSDIGHLVIAGLQDNTCNFEIGFPQSGARAEHFSIPLQNKDHGYQLVKTGAREWALYNWQTQETIKPAKQTGGSDLLYGERKKDDAFASLMAAVVNDTAVLYTSVVRKEPDVTAPVMAMNSSGATSEKEPVKTMAENPVTVSKPDTVAETKKADTLMAVTHPAVNAADSLKEIKTEPARHDTVAVTNKPVMKDTLVAKNEVKEPVSEKKLSGEGIVKVQQQTKDGQTRVIYVDSSQSPAEFITIYIPEEKQPAEQPKVVTNPSPVEPVTANTAGKMESQPAPVQKNIENSAITATPVQNETGKKVLNDTLTIVLESKQMKKDTVAVVKEPLYRPKVENKQETAAPVSREPAKTADTVQKQAMELAPVKTDTAHVQNVAKQETPGALYEPKPADTVKKAVMEPVATKKDTALTTTQPEKNEEKQPLYKPKTAEPEKKTAEPDKKLVMINSDCARFATDNDVDKLRVKMLAENDWQKRVGIANKVFKTMCLSAKQMKALTELFPTDETKFGFLQMAYPFASDAGNFKQLFDVFTDEAYQTKFKTMVHY